jgi:hypothetical protein
VFGFKHGPAMRREKGPTPNGVGSERTSSPRTQIAKQNRSAGEPEGRGAPWVQFANMGNTLIHQHR